MENLSDHSVFIERFLLSFKALGGTSDGLIDCDIVKTYLSQAGENVADILNLIKEEGCVFGDKINFFHLCSALLATKVAFNSLSLENGLINDSINTRTYTRRRGSSQATIKNNSLAENSSHKVFNHQIAGAVFNVTGDLLCNRYHIEVLEDTYLEIFIKPIKDTSLNKNSPLEILILQDKEKILISSLFNYSENCLEENYCNLVFNFVHEMRCQLQVLKFPKQHKLLSIMQQISPYPMDLMYSSIKHHFRKGKFVLLPIGLMWPEKECESVNLASLIDLNEDGKIVLTPSCDKILRTVFNTIDLDQNGLLSQLEFDLFIQYTSGETAANEWCTIEDNFHTEDNQLTYEGFVELYKLVLQTDPSDVIHMLQLMGINDELEQEFAQPFTLFIKSETSKFLVNSLPIASYKSVAEKTFCRMAIEQGSSKKIKNMNDLLVYTMKLPQQVLVVVQNQSHSKVKVRLDCSKSINYQSHQNVLDFTVEVMPKTSTLGHYLVPVDPKQHCSFECIDELK